MGVFSKKNLSDLEKYLGVKKSPGPHEVLLWEKVGKFTPYFVKIPGIRCLCIGNSLAMNNAHKNSDIDLFVITKKHRLWTARIFFTLFLTLIGQRKTSKKHAGKFCLSFFISEDNLSLDSIAIKDDIYLSYWIETLKPIINRKRTFERFLSINSPLNSFSFQEKETINYQEQPLPVEQGKDSGWSFIAGNLLESLFKFLFLPRTKKSFQELAEPFGVVISDTMLKFHDKDRRKEIRKKIISS